MLGKNKLKVTFKSCQDKRDFPALVGILLYRHSNVLHLPDLCQFRPFLQFDQRQSTSVVPILPYPHSVSLSQSLWAFWAIASILDLAKLLALSDSSIIVKSSCWPLSYLQRTVSAWQELFPPPPDHSSIFSLLYLISPWLPTRRCFCRCFSTALGFMPGWLWWFFVCLFLLTLLKKLSLQKANYTTEFSHFLPLALAGTIQFSHFWTGSLDCNPYFSTDLNSFCTCQQFLSAGTNSQGCISSP